MYRSKISIIKACRMLHERGLISGAEGNVSVLERDIAITPSLANKSLIEAEDILLLNRSGDQLPPFGKGCPSSERYLHAAIYDAVNWARAVVHVHSPFATALAYTVTGKVLPIDALSEGATFPGPVYILSGVPPSSKKTANVVGQFLTDNKGLSVVMLRAHGAVAWGSTLEEAVNTVCSLEQMSKTCYHIASILGLKALKKYEG